MLYVFVYFDVEDDIDTGSGAFDMVVIASMRPSSFRASPVSPI